jgi:LacI family transcriptional regulator
LDELMVGRPPPKEPIRIPPAGLIVRQSSDLLAVNHPGVARSLRFLWKHYDQPIRVGDLAKLAGMSVRGLEQAFVERIGRSPAQELHRVRIERAKQLLTAPDSSKTEAVAAQCGYPNPNSFWVAFRRATGMSPARYRESITRGF